MQTIVAVVLAGACCFRVTVAIAGPVAGQEKKADPQPAKLETLEQMQARAIIQLNNKLATANARPRDGEAESERLHVMARVAAGYAEMQACAWALNEVHLSYQRAKTRFARKEITAAELEGARKLCSSLKADYQEAWTRLRALTDGPEPDKKNP